MDVINATSVRDTVNTLAELLKRVHKPYAGARVRIAFLRESGLQFSIGSAVFLPEAITERPAADYGRLLFVEEWWDGQERALDQLSKLLEGQATVGGHKVNFQFGRSDCFHANYPLGRHVWSRWECRSYTRVDSSLYQPLQYGPVLGFGLPPYLGPNQAVQDWVLDSRPDSADSQVPNLGQLVIYLPDLRARFVSALWTPGKLRVELELNSPVDTVELQIHHTGSAKPYQICPAKGGVCDLLVPDDTRELQLYLVHDSGDCIAHIQLRSLYDTAGEIGSELSATSRAEMDFERGESEQVEFKPFISPFHDKETQIVKTVIAFANTAGGRIYIGVSDENTRPLGEVELRSIFTKRTPTVALRDQADRVRVLIANKVVPSPTVSVEEIHPGGDPVVVVTVERGPSLYHTQENQVFVRKGSSNRQPTPEELRALLLRGAESYL